MDRHLVGRKYLVGDSITIADIGLVCSLYNSYTKLFDRNIAQSLPSLTSWFRSLVELDQFKEVMGQVTLLAFENDKTEL